MADGEWRDSKGGKKGKGKAKGGGGGGAEPLEDPPAAEPELQQQQQQQPQQDPPTAEEPDQVDTEEAAPGGRKKKNKKNKGKRHDEDAGEQEAEDGAAPDSPTSPHSAAAAAAAFPPLPTPSPTEPVATAPLTLAVRTRDGCGVVTGPAPAPQTGPATDEPWTEDPARQLPGCDDTELAFSADGSLFAHFDPTSNVATVSEANSFTVVFKAPETKIQHIALSPRGSYLVLYRRYEKDDRPNLSVHNVRTGELVQSFIHGVRWPALEWTSDETLCLRVINDGFLILHGATLQPWGPARIDEPRLALVVPSPTAPALWIATFAPSLRGKPGEQPKEGNVKVYSAPRMRPIVIDKPLPKADDADLKWNSTGTHLLLNTRTETDTTGRSYYGDSHLFILSPKTKQMVVVETGRGRIHDVEWAPSGTEFCFVCGEMPNNTATVADAGGRVLYTFDFAPRNTVSWSPNSQYLALCGFGNLAGRVHIFDRRHLGTPRALVGELTVNSCTSYSWSPDSRYFMTAITAPRMRLDNRIIVWKHNGQQVYRKDYRELYQADWRPRPVAAFPASRREPSPPPAKPKEEAAKPALFKARGGSSVSDMIKRSAPTISPASSHQTPARPEGCPVGMAPEVWLKMKAEQEKKKRKEEEQEKKKQAGGAAKPGAKKR